MMKAFSRYLAIVVLVAAIPAVSVAFGSALAISEKYKEKVICTDRCGETPSGSFKGFATVDLSDSFMSALDEDSTFTLHVGDFTFVKKLGQDPNYNVGKTSARLQDVLVTTSGTVVFVKVKLNWSFGVLFVNYKGTTPFAASPAAASFVGTSVGSKTANVPAEVSLATAGETKGFTTSNFELNGALTRKTKNVDGVDYELDKISLIGSDTF